MFYGQLSKFYSETKKRIPYLKIQLKDYILSKETRENYKKELETLKQFLPCYEKALFGIEITNNNQQPINNENKTEI